MKAVLIQFPYTDGSYDECRGYRSSVKIGVALLVEDGVKKVVATERPWSEVQFFQLMGKNSTGRFSYYPLDSAAILPETDYSVIKEVKFPEEVLRTMLDAVDMARQIAEAKKAALEIVLPARNALPY